MKEHASRTHNGASAALFRFAGDTFAGLTLFLSILIFSAGDASVSAVLDSGHRFLAGHWLTGAASGQSAPLLLAGVFSLLVALNLAFFRHLHGTYAAPRQRSRRI
jgi:hypothetical protein